MGKRATSRILLAGSPPFALALRPSLTDDRVEVVGWARDADDIATLVDTLRPEIVLLEADLCGYVEHLAHMAAVVALSPPESPDGPDAARGSLELAWNQYVQTHLDILKTALALAITTPVPPTRSSRPAPVSWALGRLSRPSGWTRPARRT